ncbi:MAG: type IV pilus modification protein PilV [Burkholderiaceae bacterium]
MISVRPPRQSGISMIEVLVTIVILAFGLLGLAGLHTRLQISEMEAYQRSQALLLLDDMANRISTNRYAAASYVTGTTPAGTGNACTATTFADRQSRDACEWSNALLGAAEVSGTSKVGALIGGRGCVSDLGNGEYMITVAWQGSGPLSAPPASVTCGQSLYDSGTRCTQDFCRRTVSTVVRINSLS